jgi:type II secretory pathway pseudopilin PulG
VVVTIIGILAGIAVPKFQTFKARAIQTEAKSGLNGVYLSMQAYMANYGDYPDIDDKDPKDAEIGFTLQGNKAKYKYHMVSEPAAAGGDPGHWAATSVSLTKLANNKFDVLRINTNKWTCAPFDAVGNKAATEQTTAKTASAVTDCPQKDDGAAATFKAVLKDADKPD